MDFNQRLTRSGSWRVVMSQKINLCFKLDHQLVCFSKSTCKNFKVIKDKRRQPLAVLLFLPGFGHVGLCEI